MDACRGPGTLPPDGALLQRSGLSTAALRLSVRRCDCRQAPHVCSAHFQGASMKALDLFCGAGGATRGLQMAGFAVHGIDIKNQTRYCGDDFTQANALTYGTYEWFRQFDLIWASPPCQAYTALKVMKNARKHPDLIGAVRERLESIRLPYVIENVFGAPL